MNRTQRVVLWIGIGIFVLTGLFPPGARGGYTFILQARSVSLSRLCIEWAFVVLVTGGLIYAVKIDPELMLRLPCWLLCYLSGRSFGAYLDEARNKMHRTPIRWFWVLVLTVLVLFLIAIRLSIPARGTTSYGL
ncbi:MAG: hypothetical protein ACYS30_22965, partial [Planctomycetota bacterium]